MRDAGRPGFDALRAVRERVNPDVSIVSSPAALTLLQARRALHGGTGRFVIDVRDLAAESLAAAYGPKLRYRALRLAEGRAYRRADGVLAVTRRMREAIVRDYRVPPERVHLVPNGADVEQFRPHAGKVPKTTDVIFSGTLEGRRSDDLADAFVSLLRARPETRIAILGLRAGAEETEFGARLRSAGFFERIDARPPIPHAEVPRVLASARVGIVPQLDRPIFRMAVGAKFYEYLAAGIPVVAWGPAGDSELGELLAKHRCGFYASDARGFVDAVLRILNEPELEASLAKGALTASEIFDRSRVVQRAWEQVLRPLASGGL
jgi:glycosyltransferase involved in cell wall biosynthesis